MNIDEFRQTVQVRQVEAVKLIAPAAEVEEKEDEDEDEEHFFLVKSDLEDLKDVYGFFEDLMTALLEAKVEMPMTLVRQFELAYGDLHSVINQCEEFKPEDLGVPCIAVTLEDPCRGDLRVSKSEK
jgi:hypothetical protein